MKGVKVASIPHPYGTRKPKGWTPEGQEHMDNERAWRPVLAERQDRAKKHDLIMEGLAEIDRVHPMGSGGVGLEAHPGLRPMRHRVYARRRQTALSQRMEAAGLALPEILDRPGQQEGWVCEVVAVGAGVTSVKPGDLVVAHHALCWDRGGELGDGIVEIAVDCPALPDKPEGDSDRARGRWGCVDAVLVED
jgi:hypothetical protein